jgi:hypothetical protein
MTKKVEKLFFFILIYMFLVITFLKLYQFCWSIAHYIALKISKKSIPNLLELDFPLKSYESWTVLGPQNSGHHVYNGGLKSDTGDWRLE